MDFLSHTESPITYTTGWGHFVCDVQNGLSVTYRVTKIENYIQKINVIYKITIVRG
jgi:hypothetical protein